MPPKRKASLTVPAAEAPYGYEFFGPPGAIAISIGLPVVCYALAFFCNDVSGCPAPSLLHPYSFSFDNLKEEIGWQGMSNIINTKAVIGTLGYYFLSLALYAFLPAETPEGTELRSGGKLKYRFNSFSSAIFIVVILAAGTAVEGADFPVWTFISDNFVPLLTTNILICFFLAVYVYVASFSVKHPKDPNMRELAAGGHSGNVIYDWFIGRELNPRVNFPLFGEVDIKSFMELRPGMLGWIILDLAFVMQQYRNFGKVTDSMLLITAAQTIYVFDALYMEPAILTTIDIISDGFGFMLSFGDLAWLPFTYSIQARYLATYPVELGLKGIVGVFAVQATGYYIFRSVNNEKNRFRTNPNDPRVKHLTYIETAAGSRLLTSGWWGTARHINYLGDWFMSWAYVLPTAAAGYVIRNAAEHPVSAASTDAIFFRNSYGRYVIPGDAKGWGMIFTYFYMLYFAILLIHRERRDEEKCRRKYGKDWDRYCELVPYRILPYVY
ncbi:sterol C-14 reductase-like protein [Lindgomyces ingoldianus]|uniref:Sterol C-14 reductase-like protein n=1 Tax=Lindgomyces ingoldianus TaxID=673940 RepID=A0ACB6QXW7_9PLEO|nr:sterol C-14 reductase-like protein [Lindgomyces ingoldianus]KAF2471413.1 sterol C-14 reductase-like protein [Lindgomyces ingoldianus]